MTDLVFRMPDLHNPDTWISFLTLSVLEIVLGVDNVIFLAIVSNKLNRLQRAPARFIGLLLALVMRIAFLSSVVWLVGMTEPIIPLRGLLPASAPEWLQSHWLSWRDLILLAGGIFLVYKALTEIANEVLPGVHERTITGASAFGAVVLQIVALDLVFSIDSVMTAVGLSRQLPIMIAAIVLAIIVMLVASAAVARFIERHPTIKMLALTFLIIVGASLIADGLGQNVPRVYLYVVIGFSLLLEVFKLLAGRRFQDLGERLRSPYSRLIGLILVIALGILIAQNMRYIAQQTYLEVAVVVFAFQVVVEILNALARSKRQHENS